MNGRTDGQTDKLIAVYTPKLCFGWGNNYNVFRTVQKELWEKFSGKGKSAKTMKRAVSLEIIAVTSHPEYMHTYISY